MSTPKPTHPPVCCAWPFTCPHPQCPTHPLNLCYACCAAAPAVQATKLIMAHMAKEPFEVTLWPLLALALQVGAPTASCLRAPAAAPLPAACAHSPSAVPAVLPATGLLLPRLPMPAPAEVSIGCSLLCGTLPPADC